MIKKKRNDIIEYIFVSVLWLALSLKSSFDYRMIIAFVSFLLIMTVFIFVEKKSYAFVIVSVLLIGSCLIYKTNFYISVLPSVMMFINRYFVITEDNKKKNYNIINPMLTGVGILLAAQAVFIIIVSTGSVEMVWHSKIICCFAMLELILCIPILMSFKKDKSHKNNIDLQLFRIFSILTLSGVAVTTYNYILNNGFYNNDLYFIYIYPWFMFIYFFVKKSSFYKDLIFVKFDNLLETAVTR